MRFLNGVTLTGGITSVDNTHGFYTLKGYQLIEGEEFTPAMEDYLEMIYRMVQKNGGVDGVKIKDLSKNLNVQPSSSSKMVQHLNRLGYIEAAKYGSITLTEKGKAAGNYLLYRHNVINSFLCLLNHSENQLEETEKIEHFFSQQTIINLDGLVQKMIKDSNDKT